MPSRAVVEAPLVGLCSIEPYLLEPPVVPILTIGLTVRTPNLALLARVQSGDRAGQTVQSHCQLAWFLEFPCIGVLPSLRFLQQQLVTASRLPSNHSGRY